MEYEALGAGLLESRPPPRRTGRGPAPAVDAGAGDVRRPLAPSRPDRHEPSAGAAPDPDLDGFVRRQPRREGPRAHRSSRRRLDAAVPARRATRRRLGSAARLRGRRRPRSERVGHRVRDAHRHRTTTRRRGSTPRPPFETSARRTCACRRWAAATPRLANISQHGSVGTTPSLRLPAN